MNKNNKKLFLNTLSWGFILWLIGCMLGIMFFFFVPKEYIGFAILPIGSLITVWVLLNKIQRPSFVCYFKLGFLWTIIAVILDYIFIVKLFNSGLSYYKLDVYLYYLLTLMLPIFVGYYKLQVLNNHRK